MRLRDILRKVKRGYKESGLKPCVESFYSNGACCPLSAMAATEGVDIIDSNNTINWAGNKFGYKWATGFYHGVDLTHKNNCVACISPEGRRGYDMGKKVRLALNLKD